MQKAPQRQGLGLTDFCAIQSAMDLFSAMLAKGLIVGAWAFVSEWFWPESLPDEQGGCYRSTQGLLQLPAPEDAPDLLRLSAPLEK